MENHALTRQEIFAFLDANHERLIAFGVKKLGLFGSFARGESSPGSDLDFLVVLEPKTFDAYMDLKFFLEEGLGRSVDLVLEEALKPSLRPSILREAVYAQGI